MQIFSTSKGRDSFLFSFFSRGNLENYIFLEFSNFVFVDDCHAKVHVETNATNNERATVSLIHFLGVWLGVL